VAYEQERKNQNFRRIGSTAGTLIYKVYKKGDATGPGCTRRTRKRGGGEKKKRRKGRKKGGKPGNCHGEKDSKNFSVKLATRSGWTKQKASIVVPRGEEGGKGCPKKLQKKRKEDKQGRGSEPKGPDRNPSLGSR